MTMQYTLLGSGEESNITVFIPGRDPVAAHSSHPNFEEIVSLVMEGDEAAFDLFDIAQTVSTKFESLTERISTANGILYLDGEEVHNSLTEQVLRFLRAGVPDWIPLVNFFEKVQQNPQPYSREQLFSWLDSEDFTITSSGLILGYKGVRKDANGKLTSINQGKAIVNGQVHNGAIPNEIGDIVEMPRNEVTFNPDLGCHRGLHVGTYGYANSFAQGALLEVHVNPRDVVSVPNDSSFQKMRVCRYKVIGVIDKPYTTPVVYDYENDDDEGWGEADYDEPSFF